MDPPAHDSPKHILNVLIDDCVDEIFRRIFCLEDFLNMSEVCQRFQKSAKNCFRMQFKLVYLFKRYRQEAICVPSTRAIALLNTFGPSIQGLQFQTTSDEEHNDEIFESIVKFTSKTLKELHIDCYTMCHTIDFEQMPFPALEILHLGSVLPKNIEQIVSHLKGLSISHIEPSCFIREFPRLEMFRIVEDYFHDVNYITDDMFCEFVSLNPQLQRLAVIHCNKLTPLILQAIGDNSMNLVELSVSGSGFRRTPSLLDTNLPYLGSLNQLKYLEIQLNTTTSFKIMINTFAENEVPIEKIKVDLLIIEGQPIDPCSDLKTIKTLKHVDIDEMKNRNLFNENEVLANLIRTQTALETIEMMCYDESPMPILNIGNMLKHGGNLRKFELYTGILDFNLESYESVLCLVRNRTRVEIILGNQKSKCIPEGVVTNNEWLEVRYVTGSDKRGACIHVDDNYFDTVKSI
ncbi:uncharacterized protein LOC129572857 [Sitodiplosis mosellana]|uniref:uncharacterized protein LOC129572857 n=1 Tax=Sitodiplosis mosellana TaxID=263140 RepID=UPI0024439531|nr:uncharacterized protein LOC129572857 [Sitodiplosis mosellana]